MKITSKKQPQFITDTNGKKLSVVLSVNQYRQMITELEELADIRMYDAVKSRNEKTFLLEEYLIQRKLKKKHA